jgi:hypothetical protein
MSWRAALGVLLLLISASCASVDGYMEKWGTIELANYPLPDGPGRAYLIYRNPSLRLRSIDHNIAISRTGPYGFEVVELPPGGHVVTVAYESATIKSEKNTDLSFEAAGGSTYELNASEDLYLSVRKGIKYRIEDITGLIQEAREKISATRPNP